jgi:UDP-N-acetyl-alpha-D-muramoyl-L-alanyl-L-glutamate epimerase
MKMLTFREVEIGYPSCTLVYDVGARSLTKSVNVSDLNTEDFYAADQSTVRHLLAHVGMSYIPHWFALGDFDSVTVCPLRLSRDGIEFYETYLQQGLAELRLRNGLDVGRRVRVNVATGAPRYQPGDYIPRHSAILLNGGGKDTAVAGELLREIGLPFVWFTLGRTPAMNRVARLSGSPQTVTLTLSGSLQVMRGATQYPGHKPFSSLLAFLALLVAFVNRHKYVVAANEYSANFGNAFVDGLEVNHQYPKSHDFETRFRNYVNSEVLPPADYFSVLRPLYEIQITKLFAEYPKYFVGFRSCNIGNRGDYWCLNCPKCAFILLALAPHLDKRQLRTIFGPNAFALPRIRKLILMLCSPSKPFECVGTQEESLLALWMAHNRHRDNQFIGSLWQRCRCGTDMPALQQEIMGQVQRPHSIPAELVEPVMAWLSRHLAAAPKISKRLAFPHALATSGRIPYSHSSLAG